MVKYGKFAGIGDAEESSRMKHSAGFGASIERPVCAADEAGIRQIAKVRILERVQRGESAIRGDFENPTDIVGTTARGYAKELSVSALTQRANGKTRACLKCVERFKVR